MSTTEFMRRYRERVDEVLKPHREIYGDNAPVVVMGLRLLAEAETLAVEVENEMVSTAEAADRTGWHVETLQARAKARLEGQPMPPGWEGLDIQPTARGYLFRIGTIPPRPQTLARAKARLEGRPTEHDRKRKSAADHYAEGVAAREAGEQPDEHRLYHVPWVAGYLGLATDSVYRMVARGRLKKTAVGPELGSTRIRGADLSAWIERRRTS